MTTTDTTSSRDRVGKQSAAPSGKLAETYSQFVPGKGSSSYTEELERSHRRKRVAKFAVCGSLWALAAVPLAREIAGGGGFDTVFTYIAVALVSLGIAAAIRWVYVLVTRAALVSASVFVVAAVLAIVGYGIQSGGEPQPAFPNAAPEPHGQQAE